MTIGPAPTTQMEWRSSLRGTELLDPGLDHGNGIMRAGSRLGVELDGAGALGGEREALDRAVVERTVRDELLRPGPVLDSEAVVLGGDQDAAGGGVEYRMV